VGRWWAESNTDGREIEYFRRQIEYSGQPALDVVCGFGRLLLPYLRAGLGAAAAACHGDSCHSRSSSWRPLPLPRTFRRVSRSAAGV